MSKKENTSPEGVLQQFNLVIYPIDFVVTIGKIEDQVNKYYKPFNEDCNYIASPRFNGCTYRVKEKKTGIPCILIWMPSVEDCTSSIIAHECTHAAMEIFSYIGSKPNPDDQEPFCYLLGNLMRLAVNILYDIPGTTPKLNE